MRILFLLTGLLFLSVTAPTWAPADLVPAEDSVPSTPTAIVEWLRRQAERVDPHAQVLLDDGSIVQGDLLPPREAAWIEVQVRFAKQPLRLRPTRIARIEFHPRVDLPVQPPAQLKLHDGSSLFGVVVHSLDEQSLFFSTPYVEGLKIPRHAVASLHFVGEPPSAAQTQRENHRELEVKVEVEHVEMEVEVLGRLVEGGGEQVLDPDDVPAGRPVPVPPTAPASGRLWLVNGDVMTGEVLSIAEGRLRYRLALGPEVELPMGRVSHLTLPAEEWSLEPDGSNQPFARATLITGEVWRGGLAGWDDQVLRLEWIDGQTVALPRGLLHSLDEFRTPFVSRRDAETAETDSKERSLSADPVRLSLGGPGQ